MTRLPAILLFLPLGACVSMADEPSPQVSPVLSEHILSTTASISNTLVLDRNTSFVTCTGPPPDASFSQGEQASISALISGNDDKASEGEDSEEAGLKGRSPAVLLSREMFFRACEFSRNYQLTKDEALQLYMQTLGAVVTNFENETGGAKAVTVSRPEEPYESSPTPTPSATPAPQTFDRDGGAPTGGE